MWNGVTTKESQYIIVYQPQNSKIFIKNGYGLPCQLINKLKELNINQIEVCGTDIDAIKIMERQFGKDNVK